MITLALHHDESVFVYLSETSTNKKNIEQLGFFPMEFHLDRSFLFHGEARNLLSKMLKNVLAVLKIKGDSCFFSLPADLSYLSFYEDMPEEKVRDLIDRDLWLTELKLGKDYIEQSDCQLRMLPRRNGHLDLSAVYFPGIIKSLFTEVCRENHCDLQGLGINIFNETEVAARQSADHDYWLISLEKNFCELVHMQNDTVTAFARFSGDGDQLQFFARQGIIEDELCEGIMQKDPVILRKYPLFLTCAGTDIEPLEKFRSKIPYIRILDPMRIDTVYRKPATKYNEQYNTVFSCALGALI
jgi:hypothetical protein